MSLDREFLTTRSKHHKSRKNEKDFLLFSKKSLFFKQLITEIIKIFSQKGGFGLVACPGFTWWLGGALTIFEKVI
jgi:hypothetical protein